MKCVVSSLTLLQPLGCCMYQVLRLIGSFFGSEGCYMSQEAIIANLVLLNGGITVRPVHQIGPRSS